MNRQPADWKTDLLTADPQWLSTLCRQTYVYWLSVSVLFNSTVSFLTVTLAVCNSIFQNTNTYRVLNVELSIELFQNVASAETFEIKK